MKINENDLYKTEPINNTQQRRLTEIKHSLEYIARFTNIFGAFCINMVTRFFVYLSNRHTAMEQSEANKKREAGFGLPYYFIN